MVTHENDIAQHATRIIRFRDGRIYEDGPVVDPKDARVELEHFLDEQAKHDAAAGINRYTSLPA
jgi:ABC-type lipoprotein export system ATPase subunit